MSPGEIVFSAAGNGLLQSSSCKEVSIGVFAADIAAAEPSVDEARGTSVRIVEISGRNRCAANPNFSQATCCSFLSIWGYGFV
jgi:hypothetical protein